MQLAMSGPDFFLVQVLTPSPDFDAVLTIFQLKPCVGVGSLEKTDYALGVVCWEMNSIMANYIQGLIPCYAVSS